MDDIKFIDPAKLETLEQYGASLIVSMLSLKTAYHFQQIALKIGILDEAETAGAVIIANELLRLSHQILKQAEAVSDRAEIGLESIMSSMASLAPDIKKKRGRRPKNE